jgi:hypothetical protein
VRGFVSHFDACRHECLECDGQFEDDNSHLRVADGHAAVCAAKPIILGECNVLCLVSGSHRDLELGLTPTLAPRAKCDPSAGPRITMHVPSCWDEWRPTPSAGHIGGNPHDYDHRKFDESQSRC